MEILGHLKVKKIPNMAVAKTILIRKQIVHKVIHYTALTNVINTHKEHFYH